MDKKRGEVGDTFYPTIIRVVVYLIFFSSIFYFVNKASTGALIYEQSYAKGVALMIDNSRPGTTFSIDYSNGYDISKKNGVDVINTVFINEEQGYIEVTFTGSQPYRYYYFSKYKIEKEFDVENKRLIIHVLEENLGVVNE